MSFSFFLWLLEISSRLLISVSLLLLQDSLFKSFALIWKSINCILTLSSKYWNQLILKKNRISVNSSLWSIISLWLNHRNHLTAVGLPDFSPKLVLRYPFGYYITNMYKGCSYKPLSYHRFSLLKSRTPQLFLSCMVNCHWAWLRDFHFLLLHIFIQFYKLLYTHNTLVWFHYCLHCSQLKLKTEIIYLNTCLTNPCRMKIDLNDF